MMVETRTLTLTSHVCWVWCSLSVLVPPSSSSNVILAPYPFSSHVQQMAIIGTGLQRRGHRVSILLPDSYPELDPLRRDFDVVTSVTKEHDIYSNEKATTAWKDMAPTLTPIEEMRTSIDGFIQLCTNPLEDEGLSERLRKRQLDLAIVDGFPGTWCLYIIMYKLGVPYVSITNEYEPWIWRNPALPSFVPFPLAGLYTERMTFSERVMNLVTQVDWTAWPRVPYMEDDFARRYLPAEDSHVTFSWLNARSLVWFIHSDVAIDYPRPTMPNEVHVGGLTTRPALPLTGDLKTFVDGADKGLIVVSFGSTGILEDAHHFEQLLSAFTQFEQRFVWKFSGGVPVSWSERMPFNVKVMEWLPQNDLLGHPNCVLFVTHCGANGQFEALYHGVPMLGIPVFGDQPYNARRIQYLGYGRFLVLRTSGVADLVDAITEMLGNRSYSENVRRGSLIFRDRTQTPMERAVWWVEHVLRHGGQHLHSVALDMPWHEYLMLDILLVLVVLPAVTLTGVLSCLASWCLLSNRLRIKAKEKRK